MIAVAGEALMDVLPAERDGPTAFTALPGGAPFNVARFAALLAGYPTSVTGVTVNRLCASGLFEIGI